MAGLYEGAAKRRRARRGHHASLPFSRAPDHRHVRPFQKPNGMRPSGSLMDWLVSQAIPDSGMRPRAAGAIGPSAPGSDTLAPTMSSHPPAWLKAPQIIGGEVQHLVQGGAFLIRVLVERLIDDDRDAAETLDFSYRGVDYQIDLSAPNARALDKLLAPILDASRRRVERPVTRRSGAGTPSGAPAAKAVRAWARNEGIEVSDRGRVPADVVKRYQDAHRG